MESLIGSTWSSGMPTFGLLSWYRGLLYGMTVFKASLPPDNCRITSTGSLVFDAIACLSSVFRRISILLLRRSTGASGPLSGGSLPPRCGSRHQSEPALPVHCGSLPPVCTRRAAPDSHPPGAPATASAPQRAAAQRCHARQED